MSQAEGSFQLDWVRLREIRMPFLRFFETSFGRVWDKEAVLIEVSSGGVSGWGECVAAEGPFFSYEDKQTAWHVLTEYLIPTVLGPRSLAAADAPDRMRRVRGHPMAKAALESALWDLEARRLGRPLWRHYGGTQPRIPCGVSIGIQDSPKILLERIRTELDAGYQRIKIKIKPGWDTEIVEQVRNHFPDIPLMVDANAAYTLEDAAHLRELDRFDLMMIEQPLHHEDILGHARLQREIGTAVCLDESVRHCADLELALEVGACRILNLKPGRVGGPSETLRLHRICQDRGVGLWCGGMLETGIGRAHNIALATLDHFRIPGDVSASSRYFERDTIVPAVEVTDGWITPSEEPGIGYEPDLEWIDHLTVRGLQIRREEVRA